MLLHRPTKLFLIPVISIRRTSVVSVMLLCNKLAPKRFHSQPRVLQNFENAIPKTPQRKRLFDQRKRIKTPGDKAQAAEQLL